MLVAADLGPFLHHFTAIYLKKHRILDRYEFRPPAIHGLELYKAYTD